MADRREMLAELTTTTQLAAAAVALAAFSGRPTGLRTRLVELRARIDELITELPGEAREPPPVAAARFLSCPKFAALRGLSDRTIREYCDLGMPHSGQGRGRRVLVAEAALWIDGGGPSRARMARKRSG